MSVDTIEDNARLSAALGLEFPILSDVEERVINSWGLVHANAGPNGATIARPAIFLVEPDGTISWRRLTDNWRVRERPEDILEMLRSTG